MHFTHRHLAAVVLITWLAACTRSPPPDSPAAPDAAAVPAAPAAPEAAPADLAPPQEAPPPEAPPPADQTARGPQMLASVPEIGAMRTAIASSKMSVAAELRYSFDAPATENAAVTLHLAAVADVPGQTLKISVQDSPGVTLAAGPPSTEKVNSADVVRQQFSLTRAAGSPDRLRVLVTMESAAGSGFGFFTIPLDGSIR